VAAVEETRRVDGTIYLRGWGDWHDWTLALSPGDEPGAEHVAFQVEAPEDLERYAGAGLYESVLARDPEARRLDYAEEPIVWDADFREKLLRGLTRIGTDVARGMGAPQDIEGAVRDGKPYLVQTRAQVGL
jgi:hypothetical protein